MSKKDERLAGMLIFITGACGLLGRQHAEAVLESGGMPVLIDINKILLESQGEELSNKYDVKVPFFCCDIAVEKDVNDAFSSAINACGSTITGLGLVNNAAINPKVESNESLFQRPENLNKRDWDLAFDVGLYGALLCSVALYKQVKFLQLGQGAIVNISSDHGLISPKQSLYSIAGVSESNQPVKPITYTLVKHAIIGMTRYFSTLWASEGIRVNTLCPGGVQAGQGVDFLERFRHEVPLRRMANVDEYKGSIVFLLSNDSSYMTGATLVVDGGRTIW